MRVNILLLCAALLAAPTSSTLTPSDCQAMLSQEKAYNLDCSIDRDRCEKEVNEYKNEINECLASRDQCLYDQDETLANEQECQAQLANYTEHYIESCEYGQACREEKEECQKAQAYTLNQQAKSYDICDDRLKQTSELCESDKKAVQANHDKCQADLEEAKKLETELNQCESLVTLFEHDKAACDRCMARQTEVQATMTETDASRASCEEQLAGKEQALANCEENIASEEQGISTCHGQLKTAQENLTKLQQENTRLTNELNALKAQMELEEKDLKGQVEDLQHEYSDANKSMKQQGHNLQDAEHFRGVCEKALASCKEHKQAFQHSMKAAQHDHKICEDKLSTCASEAGAGLSASMEELEESVKEKPAVATTPHSAPGSCKLVTLYNVQHPEKAIMHQSFHAKIKKISHSSPEDTQSYWFYVRSCDSDCGDDRCIRLEAYDKPNSFLHHKGTHPMEVLEDFQPEAEDSSFCMRHGFTDSSSVSLEAVNNPGSFVSSEDGDNLKIVPVNEGSNYVSKSISSFDIIDLPCAARRLRGN